MKFKLDDIDYKVLDLLIDNSRIPYQLAIDRVELLSSQEKLLSMSYQELLLREKNLFFC